MILVSRSGLVSIAGGKWTTYRKMASSTLDQAILNAQLDYHPSVSETLQIHGYHNHADNFNNLACYGSDALKIQELVKSDSDLEKPLGKHFYDISRSRLGSRNGDGQNAGRCSFKKKKSSYSGWHALL